MPGLQDICSVVTKGDSLFVRAPSITPNTTPKSTPSGSPSSGSVKRRFSREPMRAPQSASDARFGGITFMIPFSGEPQVISQSASLFAFQTPSVSRAASASPAQSQEPEAAGHETETEDEIEEQMAQELAELELKQEEEQEMLMQQEVKKAAKTPKRPAAKKRPAKTAFTVPAAPQKTTSNGGVIKHCFCCGNANTPLWRDLGPIKLCNACGIRYKKYSIMCETCYYVPCKVGQYNKVCTRCQHPLPPVKRARVD